MKSALFAARNLPKKIETSQPLRLHFLHLPQLLPKIFLWKTSGVCGRSMGQIQDCGPAIVTVICQNAGFTLFLHQDSFHPKQLS